MIAGINYQRIFSVMNKQTGRQTLQTYKCQANDFGNLGTKLILETF